MSKRLIGVVKFRGKLYPAEFTIESERDLAQEEWDQKRERDAARTQRAKELLQEFTGTPQHPGIPANWALVPVSTHRAILYILDQELPSL